MRILIVDDDLSVAQTLSMIFRRHGYDAELANDADQALDAVRQTPPDLVLCDIDMPGRDGISLMKDLSCEVPECPILILTGFYSGLHRVREFANTMRQEVSVVTKPCHPTELLRHAGKLLGTTQGSVLR